MTSTVHHSLPTLLVVGGSILASFYSGKWIKRLRLPSLIGFMLVGVALGPSLFNFLNEPLQNTLSFITQTALSFVAISIGLELSFTSLKKQGMSIIAVILTESFGAFLVVTIGVYLLTRDVPLSLIFGAIAPASAPAGTVAIIREYHAKGPLTKALYAVVGFDDGLGIVIFGFAAAIARSLLEHTTGTGGVFSLFLPPLIEIGGGILVGGVLAIVFCMLARRLQSRQDIFVLLFAFVLVSAGLSVHFHLSVILTNMVLGMVVVNTQSELFVHKIRDELTSVMPLLFILFFTLAGANLHVAAIPSLGILGIVYILARTVGLIGGSRVGAALGRAPDVIRNWVGLGILSQAGVAIGLSLIVKHDFADVGDPASTGASETLGGVLGATVLTTVTATCIFFELIGPILTKLALSKAGEIKSEYVEE